LFRRPTVAHNRSYGKGKTTPSKFRTASQAFSEFKYVEVKRHNAHGQTEAVV